MKKAKGEKKAGDNVIVVAACLFFLACDKLGGKKKT